MTDVIDEKPVEAILAQGLQELGAVRELAKLVSLGLSLNDLAARAYRQISSVVKPDIMALCFREGNNLILQPVRCAEPAGHSRESVEKTIGQLCVRAAVTRNTAHVSATLADPRWALEMCKEAGIRSLAALTLAVQHEVVGALIVASFVKRDFSPQAPFLEAIAGQIAVAVKTVALREKLQRCASTLSEAQAKVKVTQEKLRLSEACFQAVFENARDRIFIKDRNLLYTHVNPAMEQLLGMDGPRIIGQPESSVFGPESSDKVQELDLRVLSGEVVETLLNRAVRGAQRVFRDTRVPLRDPLGNIVGLCGMMQDASDRGSALGTDEKWSPEYRSQSMRATIEAARLAASTDSTVLLTGESGAGKDYIARFIHDHSRRRDRLFYAVNCAAIPLELAESELFGYESGAFTGAKGAKRGMLDIPQGGTLLLNEIGELPLPIQAKLLAFLDTKSFTRVGGERPVFADVRLLAATNRDLRQEISEDRFREDLFYRLNVLSVRVPPLRERTEDIPLLARQIIAELGEKMRLAKLPVLQAETLAAMQRHHWPGNVRELRNLLERTLILFGQEEMIPERSLQLESDQAPESKPALSLPHDKSLGDLFEDMEKSLIEEALRLSSGKKEAAAKLLGISRHALKRRLQKYADLRAKTLKQIKPMA